MVTPSELDDIRRNPIKEGLDVFCRLFESICSDLGTILSPLSPLSPDVVQIVFETAATLVIKTLVINLIQALMVEPAARALPSRTADRTVFAELAILYVRLDSNRFDMTLAIPLAEQVVKNKFITLTCFDVDIWQTVFELVAQTNPTTPPTIFQKPVFDTPVRSSSASQIGSEQLHDQVDRRIREELTGRVYDDVGGFYERYFKEKTWSSKAGSIYEESRAQYTESRWSGWPEPPVQGQFFEWFMKLQNSVLSGLSHKYYTSASNVLTGSEANRKLDIFLASTNVVLLNNKHDWSHILVIGEHKQSRDEDRSSKTLVQLAGYAREVFGSQPDRRFVPGFTICGSIMRLWMFDRAGAYSSEKFDIHQESERFLKVIAGYALMTDAELGLNTFIKHDGNSKYIIAQEKKIFLEDRPIALTKAIVCRGTTCYRGRESNSIEWKYVVKFAWPSDKRQQEGRLLKLAKEREVRGVAIWFDHTPITIDGDQDTILYLRRAMKFGSPRRLSEKASWVNSNTESSRAYLKKSIRETPGASVAHLRIGADSAVTSSLRQKRKKDKELDASKLKRSRSDSYTSGKEGELDASDTHSIQEPVVDSLADCRNEWQRNNTDSIQEDGTNSLTDYEDLPYDNRVNYCLVTSPAGRPLCKYQSVKELLEALRDAICGHRSLLENGKILHRDISENNIIITELHTEGALKGRLIDLDLAKELDSKPSGARHRTGTMQFMAIEVLQGKGHTYRHDLESFFYVFVWICIRYGHEGTGRLKSNRADNILRGWYTGTYNEIANTKLGNIGRGQFEIFVTEFAPKFENLKPLARELRSTLFPIINGDYFKGTFQDHRMMYDTIIEAFGRAIDRLEKEEQTMVLAR